MGIGDGDYELKYYTINEQTKFKRNTPLHLAIKNRADKAILFLVLNKCDKFIKNKEGLTALEYLKKEKNVDPFYVKTVEKILDGKIKNYIELDSCNFEKLVKKEEDVKFEEKVDIVNGNIDNSKHKNKNDDVINKLSKGILTNFRLREILSIINTNIKSKNIDVNQLILNYDKNATGLIRNNEFNEFIKSLDIEELNMDDINFLKSFLEKDEKNNLKYKYFIMIIND